jgi:hypothetical protein
MGAFLAPAGQLGGDIVGSYLGGLVNKAKGHSARVARKKDQQILAQKVGVDYECVRQIQSSLYTNPTHAAWGPNPKAGPACNTEKAAEIGYTLGTAVQAGIPQNAAAAALGITTGTPAYDVSSPGIPAQVIDMSAYGNQQPTPGTGVNTPGYAPGNPVPISNNGSAASRRMGRGVQDASGIDNGMRPGRQSYESRQGPPTTAAKKDNTNTILAIGGGALGFILLLLVIVRR